MPQGNTGEKIAKKSSPIDEAAGIQLNNEEKEILLSLNNDITAVKDQKDILTIIHPKIKRLFNTDDIFICSLDSVKETLNPILRVGGPTRIIHPDYDRTVSSNFPIHDGFIDSILNSDEPVIVDLESFSKSQIPPNYMRLSLDTGLEQSLSISLHNRGEVIGILTLWSEHKNFFTSHHKKLIKEIANNISIVVSNILANENIAKREEEKTILLALSTEIAAVKNRQHLFEVLNTRLKSLFSIEEFGIAQIDKDGKTYSAFIHELEESLNTHAEFRRITADKFLITDPIANRILNSEEPILFEVAAVRDEPEMPAYVQFWKKAYMRRVLGVALRVGGKNVGFAILHIDKNESIDIKSNLLGGVCAQLAVKMSNLLAYEEIAQREEEKTILLSLSNSIAGMRSRNDFFEVVIARLKKIFTFDGFAITYIHEDGKTFGVFNVDKRYDVQNIPGYKNVLSARVPVSDPHYNIIIHSEEPVLFKVDEMVAGDNIISMAAFSKISGIRQFLSVPLRVGGKTIGAASFHSFGELKIDANNNLLKGICAQIAVAVSNIIAHEKILNQLDEINKYKQQLEDEKIYLKEEIESAHNYAEIIGESAEIKKVFRLVTQVAYSDSTVLVLGETGTGKELIARAIHNSSTRKNRLMVKVNCAALPANLIESELFGHERGSFTGAIERRIGKFELANNGTLFLDEIGEMTPELQVKLLRALQEKEIERVGGKTTIKTDVRIIAATNRDLEKLMEEGKFRSDLYYRLNIFPISLPPLRNRREDIPQLASYFIVRYSKKAGKKINTISSKTLKELIQYDWPGNIRELEHLIERSVLLATGDTIKEIDLPHRKRNIAADVVKGDISVKTIDENEKEHILKILKHVKGRIGGVGGAAELLGVPTSTLNSRIKRLGIRKEHL